MNQILSRVRRDITDFPRVDAVLSTTVRAVQFCRTLSDGRVSTQGFFRPLLASLLRPLLLARCALSQSFVRLIRHFVGEDLCIMRQKCPISSKRHKKSAA